jgi:hypothetical protein
MGRRKIHAHTSPLLAETPMHTGSEEKYQIATLVLLTITGLVVVFYAIIFINPRVAFNPFKPPLPTATFIAALPILQPTWTPTETSLPTLTTTPTSTATATLVVPPLPTLPLSTATSTLTVSPTATPRPPTRTPRLRLPRHRGRFYPHTRIARL